MASADLSTELECPVCLNIYTDPVILKCGHNYCRACIDHVLNTQEGSGGYSCPECKTEFMERPALQRNIALRNIAERFLSTQPDQEEGGVYCTYCIHSPVSAVMSCLHCDASLCDNHLTVHSKSPEHVLCDPTTSLESRKCSVHKKILEYYCTEDAACICVSCRLDGEHWGHQVEMLNEASEKKQKKLRNVLQKLMAETEEAEKRVRRLQERRRKAQQKADGETERVTALFRDLRRQLEDLEKRVLSDITRWAERVSRSHDEVTRQLEIKKEELSRKMRHIEELCNMTDPLTVLQESDTGDLCDTEEGDNEDRERHDEELHDGGDLGVADISHTLHTGLSDIMSGVTGQKRTDTPAYLHSSTEDKVSIIINKFKPHLQHTLTVPDTQCQAVRTNIVSVQQNLGQPVYADILLDVNTASNFLHISHDRKTASLSDRSQNRPDTPERFHVYAQVLSSQSFFSGGHYWEVDVGGSDGWRVGMCYPSIDRRGGFQSLIGCNNKSWGLFRSRDYHYTVMHCKKKMWLPVKTPSDRVRIYLDYKAGKISFFAVCDPIRHLHTFTAIFTEPLHAALCVLNGCIKVSGSSPEK